MVRAINQNAISIINYFIGIINFKEKDLERIDREIRKVMMDNRIHIPGACTERLYLPRGELGRGILNVENLGERIEHKLWENLEKREYTNRVKVIVENEKENKSQLSQIKETLTKKYNVCEGENIIAIKKK